MKCTQWSLDSRVAGAFVQEIRKVGTRHSRCLPSYRRKVNTRCQVFVLRRWAFTVMQRHAVPGFNSSMSRILGMYFENLGAALHVRRIHLNSIPDPRVQHVQACAKTKLLTSLATSGVGLDLTIETSRSHQSLVQDVSPVRCCNDNYPLVALEALVTQEFRV